jgi:hypothetical protein
VIKTHILMVGLLVFCGCATAIAADDGAGADADFSQASLRDLKASLARLTADSNLVAEVVVNSAHNAGEDEELVSRTGAARVTVVDDDTGLSVRYSTQLLQQMAAEASARAADSDAPTPAYDGVDELSLPDIQPMLRAARAIGQELDSAEFIGAEADTYQGNNARRLDFALGEDRLTKRQRKYVKEYDGSFTVWIDEQGAPLASRTRIHARGRAFIVISFSITIESDSHYRVDNDRLITTRRADYQLSAGAGERSERLVNKTLEVIDE